MDFQLNQEQILLQNMAADFAQTTFWPNAATWDKTGYFPKEALKEAATLGMAGMVANESMGGSGLKRLDAVLVLEQLASACVSTSAYLSIHNMVVSILDKYASPLLCDTWGKRLTQMDVFGSYCLTEPESGSDAASLKTRARKEGDEYILNGSKAFISGGGVSDVYLCMVRTGDDTHHGISCILVEKNTPGLSFGKQEEKVGWHSQPTAMLFFEECRVPVSHLVGEEGMGFKIALQALNGGRANIGACSLGGALACIRLTKAYMNERKQFGKTLTEFQALRFQFVDMLTLFNAARLMVYRAAEALDRETPDAPMLAAMAKQFASDTAFKVSDKAMQLHGGYGCLKDYPVERFFRDLRIHQVVEGTNEIMREIISKTALNEAFMIE
ncbi:MAG: acyl-CoA dehydrogenase family protein [Gammaproteobacteria bacterium]|nr:acyl-CoA dehydrogenase family protein [Gammaproteobacteria bacterium]